MASARIQLRPGKELTGLIMDRSGVYGDITPKQRDILLAETARKILEDHFKMMALELPQFSLPEAYGLANALNGCRIEPLTAHMLWANVENSVVYNHVSLYDTFDGVALVQRLKALGRTNPFACWAIIDAVYRAWNSPTYRINNMEERLRDVGLVRDEEGAEAQ